MVLLLVIVALVVLIAFLSLALDFGKRTMVDGELQAAADSAAIAAAQRLGEQPAPTAADVAAVAMAIGNQNSTIDGGLGLSSGDVEIGQWDSEARAFAASTVDKADAVRVAAHRSATRGNGVQTSLAAALGVGPLASRRQATAYVERAPDYALLGLDGFTSQGVLTVNSTLPRQGSIASNGDVKLNLLGLIGVTWIDGEVATFGTVQKPAIGLLTVIREGINRPDKPFVLPAVSTGLVKLKNDNVQIANLLDANKDLNVIVAARIPAGTYYCRNLNVLAGAVLTCDGPVTIYAEDGVTIVGTVLTLHNAPGNLKIRVAGTGLVTIAANVTLSADIYAPLETANIAAGVLYRGRLLARRINVLGTSFFYLYPELPQPELGRSRVTLVR